MATRHSTGHPPAFLPSKPVPPSIPIRPVIRGQVVFGDVAFTEFMHAVCAWSAAECPAFVAKDGAR